MRSANAGDSVAYRRLLKSVTRVLRAAARRGLARAGQAVDQAEDIVQDILLAVHLKRHTWDASAPFAPWLFAVARHKLTDARRAASPRGCCPTPANEWNAALRGRGGGVFVINVNVGDKILSEPSPDTSL